MSEFGILQILLKFVSKKKSWIFYRGSWNYFVIGGWSYIYIKNSTDGSSYLWSTRLAQRHEPGRLLLERRNLWLFFSCYRIYHGCLPLGDLSRYVDVELLSHDCMIFCCAFPVYLASYCLCVRLFAKESIYCIIHYVLYIVRTVHYTCTYTRAHTHAYTYPNLYLLCCAHRHSPAPQPVHWRET